MNSGEHSTILSGSNYHFVHVARVSRDGDEVLARGAPIPSPIPSDIEPILAGRSLCFINSIDEDPETVILAGRAFGIYLDLVRCSARRKSDWDGNAILAGESAAVRVRSAVGNNDEFVWIVGGGLMSDPSWANWIQFGEPDCDTGGTKFKLAHRRECRAVRGVCRW